MAIYHCSIKIIGRSSGRSAVAAAAYRSGTCLTNEYDGTTHDFTRKNWITHSEVMLCEHAPPEFQNRDTLWNQVEALEKSSIAQLAREVEVALPKELSAEDQLDILHSFIEKNFTSKGLLADFSVHNPPVTNDRHQPIDITGTPTEDISRMQFRNPHAHILLPLRPLDENGKWEPKSQIVYLCKKDGEEREFTASEFQNYKSEGWEKQYQYKSGKNKFWATPSEVTDIEATKVNRTPRTTPYGRKNPNVEYFNEKDRTFEWRKSWEEIVNEKFKELNQDIRIDSRSFIDQGRTDEIPTIHMGVSATNMQKRMEREQREGIEKDYSYFEIANLNRDIKQHNKLVRQFQEELKKLYESAKDTLQKLAHTMESIRAKIIGNLYQQSVFQKKKNQYSSFLASERDKILKSNNASPSEEVDAYQSHVEQYDRYENQLQQIKHSIFTLKNEYKKNHQSLTLEEQADIEQYRLYYRPKAEEAVKTKLQEHYKGSYDDSLFQSSIRKTDNELEITSQKTKVHKHQHKDSPERDFYDNYR